MKQFLYNKIVIKFGKENLIRYGEKIKKTNEKMCCFYVDFFHALWRWQLLWSIF